MTVPYWGRASRVITLRLHHTTSQHAVAHALRLTWNNNRPHALHAQRVTISKRQSRFPPLCFILSVFPILRRRVLHSYCALTRCTLTQPLSLPCIVDANNPASSLYPDASFHYYDEDPRTWRHWEPTVTSDKLHTPSLQS